MVLDKQINNRNRKTLSHHCTPPRRNASEKDKHQCPANIEQANEKSQNQGKQRRREKKKKRQKFKVHNTTPPWSLEVTDGAAQGQGLEEEKARRKIKHHIKTKE